MEKDEGGPRRLTSNVSEGRIADRGTPAYEASARGARSLRSVLIYGTLIPVIRSFRDKLTERLASGVAPKEAPFDVARRALNKLVLLDTATRLEDLRVPPGNRLEALSGSRAGQHSIRVNDQWRICFVWKDGDAFDVEFVDYH